MKYKLLVFAFIGALSLTAQQTFYDLDKIQEIKIYFAFSNWDYQLDTAKNGAEGYLTADSVIVNGEKFENCGVKYKGNSTYDANRTKNPLHIKLDYVDDADYQGIEDIKLGNGWSDNSMIREPLNYAILSQYMDAPRGNFAKVYINGTYYGLMNNAESIDKPFLLGHLRTSKYVTVKCNPQTIGPGLGSGSGLSYSGSGISSYNTKYELQSDTGWVSLINLCDTLNNHFDAFDQIADIDRFIWMLAFNNATINLDSYTGSFRQNYYLYRDHNGQWIPVVWDLNMCMGGFSIAGGTAGAISLANLPTMNYQLHKTESGWPLIYKLLNDPLYSKMYNAHLRTINNENFAGGQFKVLATQLHNLIDSEIPNDPNSLVTYSNFQVSLTTNTSVNAGGGTGTSPGLFPLMDSRATYLSNVLSAAPPVISNIAVENAAQFGNTAVITAAVTNSTAVYLGYRYKKTDRFVRVTMYDDGAHGDGAAGDNVFGADCPLNSLHVQYYIYAENSNTGAFSPERAEYEFYSIEPTITAAANNELAINELTANNETGTENEKGKIRDWLEVVNLTNKPLGLSQLYLSNDPAELDKWVFPADAFIQPNEHLLLWADDLDETYIDLHTNFNLSKSGGSLILSNGATIFDEVTFDEQSEDHSYSRCTDATGPFQATSTRTPRAVNLCTSGTDAPVYFSDLALLPNPASATVTIKTSEPVQLVQVFNLNGQILLETNQLQLNIAALPPGLYWVKASGDEEEFTVRKLVKMGN